MKKLSIVKIFFILILISSLILSNSALAGLVGDKILTLSLDTVSATAQQNDMKKGMEEAMKKTTFDWIWEAVGGVEKMATSNSEADLPGVRDRVNLIVTTVKNIEAAAIALEEGRNVDALIVTIDSGINAINHPAVTAMWEMVKLTHKSFVAVADTKAELEIEALYSVVNGDRRLVGEMSGDGPAKFNITSDSVDYFFNDYLITSDRVRQMMKSYVDKRLGGGWPEQTWKEYLSSWMAIGSGVDTAKAAETEALAGKLRNVARGWIRTLLQDINKQAQLAYDQMRMRQEMAAYEAFVERVGMFYNNDFPRMMAEFAAIRQAQKNIPEFVKLLEASKKSYAEYEKKVNGPKDEVYKNISRLKEDINNMQLRLLSAGTNAQLTKEGQSLGSNLLVERRKWLGLDNKLSKMTSEEGKKEYLNTAENEINKWAQSQPDEERWITFIRQASKQFFQQYYGGTFEPLLVPFEWEEYRFDTAKDDVKEVYNQGDFTEAAELTPDFEQIALDLNNYYLGIEEAIKKAESVLPGEVDQAINGKPMEGVKCPEFQPDVCNKMKADRIHGPKNGWYSAVAKAKEVVKTLKDIDFIYLKEVEDEFKEMKGSFLALRQTALEKYNMYLEAREFAMDNLPVKGYTIDPLEIEPYTTLPKLSQYDDEAFWGIPGALTGLATKLRYENPGITGQEAQYFKGFIDGLQVKWDTAAETWRSRVQLTEQDVLTINVLVVQNDPNKEELNIVEDNRMIEAAISEYPNYISKLEKEFQKRIRVYDNNATNANRDANYLEKKAQEVELMLKALGTSEYIDQESLLGGLGLNLKIRDDRMAVAHEPVEHLMTLIELNEIRAELRSIVAQGPSYSFIRGHFPKAGNALERLVNLSDIKEAKDENFLIGQTPVYKKDLEKAEQLIKSIKVDSDSSYVEVMNQLAEMFPQLVRKTDREGYYDIADKRYFSDEQKASQTDLERQYYSLLDPLGGIMQRRNHYLDHKDAKGPVEVEEDWNQDISSYNYFVTDVRVNTKSVYDRYDDIVLTQEDLTNGKIKISAGLPELYDIQKILVSLDGGRTWDLAPKSQRINLEFVPLPGVNYQPVIKLVREGAYQDVVLPLLDNASIKYVDINYNQLVLNALMAISNAYEQQNVGQFTELISDDYLGNKTFLEDGIRFDFDMFMDIQLKLYVKRIERNRERFIAETNWDKKQTPRSTGQQQTTSGSTTIVFVYEDGKMKIQNLRGNLLYATLSPEIAEASGLSQTVVDQIRTARDDRNATQPGAGEIEDSGGVSGGSSMLLTVQTATVSGFNHACATARYYNLTTSATGGCSACMIGGCPSDISFEGNMIAIVGSGEIQKVADAFGDIDTVPTITNEGNPAFSAGDVFVLQTDGGNFAKLEITSYTGAGPFTVQFRYAIQSDGSRNVATE